MLDKNKAKQGHLVPTLKFLGEFLGVFSQKTDTDTPQGLSSLIRMI